MTRPTSARSALTPDATTPAVGYPVVPRNVAPSPRPGLSRPPSQATPNPAVPALSPVQSSNIAGIAHDGDALWVRFKNGGLYRYAGAPRDLHDAMLTDKSPGSFFHTRIRNAHTGERIE